MSQTTKDRILMYIKHKNLSQKKFEEAAKLSNGYINNLKSSPSSVTLQKILSTYRDINQEWLLTGEGPMLLPKPEPEPENVKRTYTKEDGRLKDKIFPESLVEKLDDLEDIRIRQQNNTSEVITALVKALDEISELRKELSEMTKMNQKLTEKILSLIN